MTMDGMGCPRHGRSSCEFCDLPYDEPTPLRRMLDALPEPESVQLDTPERLPSVTQARCPRCKAVPGSDSFPCAWCSALMCGPCWEEHSACCLPLDHPERERLPPVFVDPGAVEWKPGTFAALAEEASTSSGEWSTREPRGTLAGDPVPEPRIGDGFIAGCPIERARIAELEAESTGLRAEYAASVKALVAAQDQAAKAERAWDSADRERQALVREREPIAHDANLGRKARVRVIELEAERDALIMTSARADLRADCYERILQAIVDDAHWTDDGQAYFIDPTNIQDAREALAPATEKGGTHE